MNTDELRTRIIEVKKRLPKNIIPLFVLRNPEYDNEKMKSRLSNVIQCRMTDQEITVKLEELADTIVH